MKLIYFNLVFIVAMLSVGCQKEEPITTAELMRAQGITSFSIILPKNISPKDKVAIELYNESGVISSLSFENDYTPGGIVRVFLFEENGYRISLIHGSSSWTKIPLPLEEKELIGTRGDIGPSEAFAAFGRSKALSWQKPKGDLKLMRLVVKRANQAGDDNSE